MINGAKAATLRAGKAGPDAAPAAIPTRIIRASTPISAPRFHGAVSSTTTSLNGAMRLAPADPKAPPARRADWPATPQTTPPYAVHRMALWRNDQPRRDAAEFGRQPVDGGARATPSRARGWPTATSRSMAGSIPAATSAPIRPKPGGNCAGGLYLHAQHGAARPGGDLYRARARHGADRPRRLGLPPVRRSTAKTTATRPPTACSSYQLLKHNPTTATTSRWCRANCSSRRCSTALLIRVGRYISIPDIEAQLAPNNYMYSHSMTYTFDNYTNKGIMTTLAVDQELVSRLGVIDRHRGDAVAPRAATIPNPFPNPCLSRHDDAEGSGRAAVAHRRRPLHQRQRQRQRLRRRRRHQQRHLGLQQPAMDGRHLLPQVQRPVAHLVRKLHAVAAENVLNQNNRAALAIVANGGIRSASATHSVQRAGPGAVPSATVADLYGATSTRP